MIASMRWRRAWSSFRLLLLLALAVVVVAPEWPAFGDARYQFQTIVGRARRFDFFEWTAGALGRKGEALLAGTHHFMTGEAQKQLVLGYLEQVAAAQRIEAEIEQTFANPEIADPLSTTAGLQAERDAIRARLRRLQPLAEAIVQQQVASVLAEEGLAVGGITWPPVLMTMSPVPYMLIVSPRDRIAQVDSAALIPGLSTEDKELMEAAVFDRLGQSALVVPIGGLGTYPAMIRETSSINWLAEVVSHEWTHHWLSFRPVGVRYLAGPEMRTINETVASIVDLEIGPQVIARYYPELVPPLVTPAPPATEPAPEIAFDFSAEMAETRRTVDRMLGEGEIAGAEAYMEARRRVFLDHGYNIRKLNQAYFAFYGGYAATPGGAAGADPIGPMLRELRAASPSLHAFLVDVGGLTSYDDLLALYARNVGGEPAIQ
ncbi:MAG: hypothetical protein M9896_15350 [Candidatus Promineofilum sp.]|uniref:hypothetical protein n=1 Tax=Promineifilum sp. TaxID=2664178 RepID=UPI002411B6A3|nr:hypothetical protein [Promineifilum sp.]